MCEYPHNIHISWGEILNIRSQAKAHKPEYEHTYDATFSVPVTVQLPAYLLGPHEQVQLQHGGLHGQLNPRS